MPKVSVVIPAYNAMTYLPETVDSVLKQTFDDFEIVIVNDGSSDLIQDWVNRQTDSRIRLISQENQGLSGARNTGIMNAEGKYIALLDADDLWEASKLEKQVQILARRDEVGLVYTWVVSVDAEGRSRGKVIQHWEEGQVWSTLIQHNIVECGSTPMIRRSCFDELGLFDRNLGSYVEDKDMWLRIAKRYPFAVVPEPLVYYRQHSNSASRNWTAMERSSVIVLEKAFADPPDNLSAEKLSQLKQISYSKVYLRLAWKPLQVKNKDAQVALDYQRQALLINPQLRFSKENLRLTIAIALLRYLGTEQYERVLSLLVRIRRQLFSIPFTEISDAN